MSVKRAISNRTNRTYRLSPIATAMLENARAHGSSANAYMEALLRAAEVMGWQSATDIDRWLIEQAKKGREVKP